jgi:hypothetical protein
VDTANDLSQILLVILGTLGCIVALLFLLAAIEPPATKSRHASGTGRIAPPNLARTDRENAHPAQALQPVMGNPAAN